ncbi:DUF2935 domain-containing protein [Heliobacterium undosum]|uniref:DUF2935 domain-containing protein n=1 Tax=Heliomicrobium undosum TaxID=121734 RepID=A0A845KYQ9_9FIRM|nr:DUF2935 domain-containing protein [Heliomicrobium undosum]MZP28156.1 DUF2935 domain-containing protein [Heliomicrobium undosum]
MDGASYIETALFEHRFWLQILGDHARFIYTGLAPDETQEIQRARHFIMEFDRLLQAARQAGPETDLQELNQRAQREAQEIRAFKLHLIRRHLTEPIKINLPPTLFNHMVNEVEDYLRILRFLLAGQCPPLSLPHLHLLWLSDASGHAAMIAAGLDPVEKPLIDSSMIYETRFDMLYKKAVALAGFMRTGLRDFPSLDYFNRQVQQEINAFTAFLQEVEATRRTKEVLGFVLPLVPDHMAREECYYLIKLSMASRIPRPNCDPTAPREE